VDRCASQGFIAFAPDLYHGEKTTEPDTAKKLLMELELDGAGAEISNAAQYLLTLPEVKSSTVGVIGFCMGGALAIWSATLSDEISSVVGFYPGKSWDRHKPNWINFKNKRAQIHCSEEDGTSTASSIQEAKVAIFSAGGMVEIFDYPNTRHAFFNNERPEVYDKDSAELSWERTIGFLKELP
jgi:carboxymethylenebutenolidase